MTDSAKRLKQQAPLPPSVNLAKHPIIQHKLIQLRKADTNPKSFRELVAEITLFLGFSATEDLEVDVNSSHSLSSRVALVPIMRGGLGLVDSMLTVVPMSTVYHIGMYNNPESLLPVLYYNKLPVHCNANLVLVLDVQIGSGATLIATVDIIKEWIGKDVGNNNGHTKQVKIKVITIVAGNTGLEAFCKAHPDVDVHLVAVDESCESGLPSPGVGDPGNRMFNAD